MEKYVATPANVWEVLFNSPWPIGWGYTLLGLVAFPGLLATRWRLPHPVWLVILPLIWLFWEWLASTRSVSAELSHPTLNHFASCVLCFYLGLFALSSAQSLGKFWLPISCGFVLVLAAGWQQHFGGLEQTRNYFYTYIYPQLKEVSPEYLKKIASNRIFSTLFYPNALAGTLLLVLPPVLAFIASARQRLTMPARVFLLGLVGVGALGCLLWSGSKGGWLLMLLLVLLAVARASGTRRSKALVAIIILLVALPAFFAKYARFFQRGATSVSARFDYWRAAAQIARANPVFGTGPGTFALAYAKIKRPESEMSRLVHNDYLQQACDSGLPGCFAYGTFVIGGLIVAGNRLFRSAHGLPQSCNESSLPANYQKSESPGDLEGSNWQCFAIWLGLFGWACQSLFEFALYIPALTWLAFAMLGLLLGHREDVCSSGRRVYLQFTLAGILARRARLKQPARPNL